MILVVCVCVFLFMGWGEMEALAEGPVLCCCVNSTCLFEECGRD